MAIIRACSYSAEITMPEPLSSYSRVLVTFSQDQEIVSQKQLEELEACSVGAIVTLSQAETKQFRPSEKSPMGAARGSDAFMQIRTYKEDGSAPGSEYWRIPVLDSLDDRELGNV